MKSEEKTAPRWMINSLRRSVAKDMISEDLTYGMILDWMETNDVFGNWTVYEMNNRPVNVDDLCEYCAEYYGL